MGRVFLNENLFEQFWFLLFQPLAVIVADVVAVNVAVDVAVDSISVIVVVVIISHHCSYSVIITIVAIAF